LEDHGLARAAAQGDQEAFTVLVERHRRLIYTIAYKVTLNVEDALDVTQDVLLRLSEKIGSFRGTGTFRGWVAAIAARSAVDHIRRREARRETPIDPAELTNIADRDGGRRDGAADGPDYEAQRELVERAIPYLSPQQRAVFLLRFQEGMGPKEIAERLGIPSRQVRGQLHRAVAKIRKAVSAE